MSRLVNKRFKYKYTLLKDSFLIQVIQQMSLVSHEEKCRTSDTQGFFDDFVVEMPEGEKQFNV